MLSLSSSLSSDDDDDADDDDDDDDDDGDDESHVSKYTTTLIQMPKLSCSPSGGLRQPFGTEFDQDDDSEGFHS
eukprot:3819068-Karenia_brevis.AAC.1